MKYHHHELTFEIAADWLVEAGVVSFAPNQESYEPSNIGSEEVFYVRFEDVAPLVARAKEKGIFCDCEDTGETAKQRVMRILVWLRDRRPIEPVKVVPCEDARFKYKLVAGCHRFHCALALGFKAVPAVHGFDMASLNA